MMLVLVMLGLALRRRMRSKGVLMLLLKDSFTVLCDLALFVLLARLLGLTATATSLIPTARLRVPPPGPCALPSVVPSQARAAAHPAMR